MDKVFIVRKYFSEDFLKHFIGRILMNDKNLEISIIKKLIEHHTCSSGSCCIDESFVMMCAIFDKVNDNEDTFFQRIILC